MITSVNAFPFGLPNKRHRRPSDSISTAATQQLKQASLRSACTCFPSMSWPTLPQTADWVNCKLKQFSSNHLKDLKKTSKKHTQPSHLYLTNSIVNFVFLQFLDDIRIVTLWESTSYKSTDNENHAVSRMKRFYIAVWLLVAGQWPEAVGSGWTKLEIHSNPSIYCEQIYLNGHPRIKKSENSTVAS